MLPASDLVEILTNLSALKLDPTIAAAVLGALAPLLRSSGPELEELQEAPKRPYRRTNQPRSRRSKRRRKYQRRAPRDAHERALTALKASPGATVTEIAKAAGCSRSTVANAAAELAREARKEARRQSQAGAAREKTDPQTERRSRRGPPATVRPISFAGSTLFRRRTVAQPREPPVSIPMQRFEQPGPTIYDREPRSRERAS